jgi:hypothetical protein
MCSVSLIFIDIFMRSMQKVALLSETIVFIFPVNRNNSSIKQTIAVLSCENVWNFFLLDYNIQYWQLTTYMYMFRIAVQNHNFSFKLWQTIDGRSTYQQNKGYQQLVHELLYWAALLP